MRVANDMGVPLIHIIDHPRPYDYAYTMGDRTKRVTVNLPRESLERAMEATGKGITETLVEGLREIERRELRSALRSLKGKVRFDLDLDHTRR